MDKGSGSGIFPDPDPGDPKRPDPTGSGYATLVFTTNERAGIGESALVGRLLFQSMVDIIEEKNYRDVSKVVLPLLYPSMSVHVFPLSSLL